MQKKCVHTIHLHTKIRRKKQSRTIVGESVSRCRTREKRKRLKEIYTPISHDALFPSAWLPGFPREIFRGQFLTRRKKQQVKGGQRGTKLSWKSLSGAGKFTEFMATIRLTASRPQPRLSHQSAPETGQLVGTQLQPFFSQLPLAAAISMMLKAFAVKTDLSTGCPWGGVCSRRAAQH